MKLASFFCFPFVFGDAIYQNRIGNNRWLAMNARQARTTINTPLPNVIQLMADADWSNPKVFAAIKKVMKTYPSGRAGPKRANKYGRTFRPKMRRN